MSGKAAVEAAAAHPGGLLHGDDAYVRVGTGQVLTPQQRAKAARGDELREAQQLPKEHSKALVEQATQTLKLLRQKGSTAAAPKKGKPGRTAAKGNAKAAPKAAPKAGPKAGQ